MTHPGYHFSAKNGIFWITRRNDRWRVLFEDEDLGGYVSPEQALDDLVGGHTFSLSDGTDTAALGLPDDLSEWQRTR